MDVAFDGDAATATWTCTPASSSSTNNNTPLQSQQLHSLQTSVTPSVAQTSGALIGSAIDSGIADGFATGGTLPTFGPGGGFIGFRDDYSGARASTQASNYPAEFQRSGTGSGFLNNTLSGRAPAFAAEPQSDQRFNDAFNALAYNSLPTKAPTRNPIIEREWNVWADVRGTGWSANDTSGNGNDLKGSQINVTAGLGHKLNSDTLVGVVAGYENFKYDVASIAGSLKGDGETVGAYGARRFGNIQADVAVAWSNINYSATAGTATGSFTGSRWLAKTGLTGNYNYGYFLVQPSVKLYVLWESEKAWTDSLGTLQPSRNFSAGRTALGAQVGRPIEYLSGWTLTPYAGLYGDWRFSSDNAIPTASPVANIRDGWSARVTSGLAANTKNGSSILLGGELGGLGATYKIWSGNVKGVVPF